MENFRSFGMLAAAFVTALEIELYNLIRGKHVVGICLWVIFVALLAIALRVGQEMRQSRLNESQEYDRIHSESEKMHETLTSPDFQRGMQIFSELQDKSSDSTAQPATKP